MSKDGKVAITLRVSPEQRKEWKVEAVGRDESLQDYLMGRIGGVKPSGKGSVALKAKRLSEVVEGVNPCAICKERFPEAEMVYHAKTMKWACKGCSDNQRNQQ